MCVRHSYMYMSGSKMLQIHLTKVRDIMHACHRNVLVMADYFQGIDPDYLDLMIQHFFMGVLHTNLRSIMANQGSSVQHSIDLRQLT